MNTTIAVSEDIRDQIKEFGQKGETYETILGRLLTSAKERQLQEILMDETDTSPIEEVMARARAKWRK
ncbi:MAG: hypothetical protein Q7S65_04155 [Nanoarchaeota archaeon]|nr:hypothetical protein [Nanoarchaeota archaeon]